jgi:hypothetical protein
MTPYLIIQSSWPSFGDWLILTLAVFVTLGWVLYIYFYLRPELEIGVPELSKVDWESILIPLTNKKKSRKATRIKLEVVVVDEIAVPSRLYSCNCPAYNNQQNNKALVI